MTWNINVFGVRHLSPMGAWQLRAWLDEVQPQLILIEGLHDASHLIPDMVRPETRPPFAILAYTDLQPVRTIVYPLATYSPEYQALCWASQAGVEVRFFDLPSDVFLGLADAAARRLTRDKLPSPAQDDLAPDADTGNNEQTHPGDGPAPLADHLGDGEVPKESAGRSPAAEGTTTDGTTTDGTTTGSTLTDRRAIYERIAEIAGEPDYDTFWERRFEHNAEAGAYRGAVWELGQSLRQLDSSATEWDAENLVREAWMRRQIVDAIASGIDPQKIVAIVGAAHAPFLTSTLPVMTDEEFARLPRRSCKLTLMPYSYFKLSTQSGYGAGNHAPAYFQLLWDELQQGSVDQLSYRYLSLVARQLRESGLHRSTAEVIDAVRLAETLAALHDGTAPTLADLHDAAVTILGQGELTVVRDALVRIDVGTEIGSLPKGISQTSIQDDFQRQLQTLRLERFRSAVRANLTLDLRENRRVKSVEAAFLDLARSTFLHRLRLLKIDFAELQPRGDSTGVWAEDWSLQWTPECEIALVEAVLLGETVELAAAFAFSTLLENCTRIDAAAALVHEACVCGLMKSMELARQRLQGLAAVSSDFKSIASAAWQLSQVIRYGSVRRFETAPLLPLIQELFVQSALSLYSAAACDDAGVQDMMVALHEAHSVGLEHHELVDTSLWLNQLRRLASADDRNPVLSGFACAILLEQGLISTAELAREVSRRLSPGNPAELGAGWFEGLAQRNRHALLSRQQIWQQLAEYIAALDGPQFSRAVVFLRRAFIVYTPREKRQICENLAEVWKVDADVTSELLEQPLSQEEESQLESLDDFSFDDL